MRVLLTGAGGNFGQEFIKISQFKVRQLNRHDWDSMDRNMHEVDVVIHAASDLQSRVIDHPVRLMDSNLMTTLRLLESMRDQKVPRLVFLSSCAVYGDSVQTYEDSVCRPVSINGMCKYLNEEIIRDFCSTHGIKYEIYRIFNMYGGADRFSVIHHLQQAVCNNGKFILRNQGIAQRDFIHVVDVAKIISLLLEVDVPYTHMNIGTGIATKISALFNLALQQNPHMCVETEEVKEAEYSRADVERLRSIVDFNCLPIEEYIDNTFSRRHVLANP